MRTYCIGLMASLGLSTGGCGDAPASSSATDPAPQVAANGAVPSAAKAPVVAERVPVHDFDAGPGPANLRTMSGTVAVTVDGDAMTFGHLPYGANAVVLASTKGVSRVTVTAHASAGQFPRVQLYMSGVRLDGLKLPTTLVSERSKSRTIELRLHRSSQAEYISEPGQATIVLETFDGKRLSGSFEGTLAPKGEGAPARLANGKFEVDVRVRGKTAASPD